MSVWRPYRSARCRSALPIEALRILAPILWRFQPYQTRMHWRIRAYQRRDRWRNWALPKTRTLAKQDSTKCGLAGELGKVNTCRGQNRTPRPRRITEPWLSRSQRKRPRNSTQDDQRARCHVVTMFANTKNPTGAACAEMLHKSRNNDDNPAWPEATARIRTPSTCLWAPRASRQQYIRYDDALKTKCFSCGAPRENLRP